MKNQNHFNVVVLEDNDFYNRVLTHQLQNYGDTIALDKHFSFEIQSYTNSTDCLRNLKPETDIAFLDYYLNESNALDVMKKIQKKCSDCKIIILSQIQNMRTSLQTISEGASDFISKDRNALARCCYILEEIINQRLQKGAN
ncbi:MAG: response regulator [Bacteroidetes bacterium]|nr:response regulator [Bacteroidota bacterium]